MPDPKPIVIRECVIQFDLDKKLPPQIECRVDRERSVNPELQKGLVCEPHFEIFEQGRKLIHRMDVSCRPAEKIYRRLQVDFTKQLEHLKERLKDLKQDR